MAMRLDRAQERFHCPRFGTKECGNRHREQLVDVVSEQRAGGAIRIADPVTGGIEHEDRVTRAREHSLNETFGRSRQEAPYRANGIACGSVRSVRASRRAAVTRS